MCEEMVNRGLGTTTLSGGGAPSEENLRFLTCIKALAPGVYHSKWEMARKKLTKKIKEKRECDGWVMGASRFIQLMRRRISSEKFWRRLR